MYQWLPSVGGRQDWGVMAKRYRVSFGGDENVMRLNNDNG